MGLNKKDSSPIPVLFYFFFVKNTNLQLCEIIMQNENYLVTKFNTTHTNTRIQKDMS